MTFVKICGIKNEEQALAAAQAGADFIGMVFAASPRQITPGEAGKIVAALKMQYARVKTVGVFVNMPAPTVQNIAETCRLDWVQMSGDEPWEYCLELSRPVIKAVRVTRNCRPETICDDLAYGKKLMAGRNYLILLDSSTQDKYGGTGLTFDWSQAHVIAEKYPVFVAGGLTPQNVTSAIEIISPWGVDVSSGVETEGMKDIMKIIKFIKAVREADGNQTR